MKEALLTLIKEKKKLFNQELVRLIRELEDLKEQVNKDPNNTINLMMGKYYPLHSAVTSGKIIVQVLSELELEIEKL